MPIRLRRPRAVTSSSSSVFRVWLEITGTLSGSRSSSTRSSRIYAVASTRSPISWWLRRPAQCPIISIRSGRSTARWSVIVLALDVPTPMFTMLTPARPGQHVVPGRHLVAVGIGADAAGQRGAELLQVPGVVGEQHVPLERLGGRPRVVPQPVDRQGHPLRPNRNSFLRRRSQRVSSTAGPSRGRAGRAPPARGTPRSGRPAAASRPSSRSRYQRIARGQANSPSSTGLCADQGRSTVSRG